MEYKNLFQPLKVGSMHLDNRIVMSPMTTDYGSDDQMPTEQLLSYLEERAKGGPGLITVEVCSIDPVHRYQPHSMSLGDDRFIPAHQELTRRLHQYGVKVQPQITHPGPESLAPFFEDKQSMGPSVCTNPATGNPCRELSTDDLEGIVEQYGEAARRCMQAGYDGMELHAAHCYMLLGSFLSPVRNKREDEYSGLASEGRLKLLLQVIRKMKEKTAEDFPLTLRISGYERTPGGRDINDTARIAPLLVEAGVDMFHVSGGGIDALVEQVVTGSKFNYGYNANAAEAIKRVVDVPVMVVGRIHDPKLAEQILEEGKADLIACGRPFLADPHWPKKLREGRGKEIRACISCENCIDSFYVQMPYMNCAVNAQTGRETINTLEITEKPKNVVVIGAGTGGMEAARVAAVRGHRVTLLERHTRLGGSLLFASTVHSDNERFYDFLLSEMQRLPIEIRLGVEATPELVKSLHADAIIVSTGARVEIPKISGSEQPHVLSGSLLRGMLSNDISEDQARHLPAWQRLGLSIFGGLMQRLISPERLRKLSRYWMPIGRRVVIVGNDLAAIELAEFLANRGRRVNLLSSESVLAPEVGPKRRTEHMDRMDILDIVINTDIGYNRITKEGLVINTVVGERLVKADTVILAGDPVADTTLFESLQGLAEEVHAIGDCTGLGLIRKATDDAMRVACSL